LGRLKSRNFKMLNTKTNGNEKSSDHDPQIPTFVKNYIDKYFDGIQPEPPPLARQHAKPLPHIQSLKTARAPSALDYGSELLYKPGASLSMAGLEDADESEDLFDTPSSTIPNTRYLPTLHPSIPRSTQRPSNENY